MGYLLKRLAFVVVAILFLALFGERGRAEIGWHHADEAQRQRPRPVQHKRKPQVRAYVKREPVIKEPEAQCHPAVKVVGSQYVNDAGAEDSARKAWAEQVRWLYGEAAMDIERAQEYRRRCSRSSIGEVAGQTFHRCEVSAVPCRPTMDNGK